MFTTRPDTLMGTTYMALAPGHPIVQEISRSNKELKDFLNQSAQTSEESLRGSGGTPAWAECVCTR